MLGKVEQLQAESDVGQMPEGKFNTDCSEILKTALDFYEESAAHYDKTVYEKVKKELTTNLHERLYHCFNA